MNRAPTVIAPKKAVLELNAIFENATVGILFTHNRKLMQANRLCAEMFGYTLDEFLGQSALILYEKSGGLFGARTRGGPGAFARRIVQGRNPAQAPRRQPVLVPRFGQGHRSRAIRATARCGSSRTSRATARCWRRWRTVPTNSRQSSIPPRWA
jgi:PAS domain-containing protein